MQIVTKLPNENIQNYQQQMINSGGGVNYQMQIVTKLPNGTTKVVQNDSEQPILPNLQLFQSFPTKVAQNDSEQPIWVKLLILSHSEPLQWEKIGKVVNRAKLAVPSHFEPLRWYHMVVWSQFVFGSLAPPLELIICSW